MLGQGGNTALGKALAKGCQADRVGEKHAQPTGKRAVVADMPSSSSQQSAAKLGKKRSAWRAPVRVKLSGLYHDAVGDDGENTGNDDLHGVTPVFAATLPLA